MQKSVWFLIVCFAIHPTAAFADASAYGGSWDEGPEETLPAETETAGWVYLGAISSSGAWIAPRSKNLIGLSPAELAGERLLLDMDVNLRDEAFVVSPGTSTTTCDVRESDVIGSLRKGDLIRVISSREVCAGYIWAMVKRE